MKTLIIYNDMEHDIQATIVDGDYSKFNGVCVNSMKQTGFEIEFCEWFFDEKGLVKFKLESGAHLIESKNWDKVAVTTFLP